MKTYRWTDLKAGYYISARWFHATTKWHGPFQTVDEMAAFKANAGSLYELAVGWMVSNSGTAHLLSVKF